MTNWKLLIAVSSALGAVLAVGVDVFAAEDASVSIPEPAQIAQVTSVSELSDVQPGDWAYTALQRLVEEYGCLEGYPDRTFRGNKALTRYEFAAGLNACFDVITSVIGTDTQADELQRLQEEFAAELATVRGDVDALQTDVAELEANQFSTTTKLRGELDAHLIVPFDDADLNSDDFEPENEDDIPATGDNGTVGGDEADATFEYRARLNFDTSFTGKDRLRIGLQASDDASSLANTESGLANQDGRIGDLEDNVGLDDVYYSFPIGSRVSAIIAANSIVTDDFVTSTIVPFDGPAIAGASTPEFYGLYEGGDALGAGVNVAFTKNLVLDLGYASGSGNDNSADGGIFNGGSYIAQLNLLSDGIFNAAVTYIGATDPSEGDAESSIAGLLSLDFGRFQIGGHYAANQIEGGGDADSYMGGVAISDLFGAGNQLGIYGGISPSENRDPLLVEAYYQISVNEFFTFTPAIIYADNDSGSGQDDNFYGALRASFSF